MTFLVLVGCPPSLAQLPGVEGRPAVAEAFKDVAGHGPHPVQGL
jgi:hypothetical protein